MQTLTLPNPALARAQKWIALLTLSLPLLGAVGAACWALPDGVSNASLTVFAVLYLLTAAGVSVGFHRLFTHKSFKTTPDTGGGSSTCAYQHRRSGRRNVL